jgi:uncharacterized phage protein (TIGR02216 family)
MAVGLGVLGLPPAVFWAMSPKELEAALRGRTGGGTVEAPPSRAAFAVLADRFPDQR